MVTLAVRLAGRGWSPRQTVSAHIYLGSWPCNRGPALKRLLRRPPTTFLGPRSTCRRRHPLPLLPLQHPLEDLVDVRR
jgi:hypothetical protein